MRRLSDKKLEAKFSRYSDEQLNAMFDAIGTKPEHRVKRTNMIKLASARFGDEILAEQQRRKAR